MIEKKEAQKLLSSLNEMINEYWFDMIIKRWQKLGYIKDNEQQDSKLKECLDCNNYNTIICESCQNNAMFKKIQKPKVENINVDDICIVEKKVDKLEEARKYNYTMFDIHYLRNEDLEKLLYNIQDQTFICLGEHLEQIKLFQQAIEQIIKEKDNELETFKQKIKNLICDCSEDNCIQDLIENQCEICIIDNLKQLKQKKPPRKYIEWLKNIRDNANFFDSIQAKELLEFLEKIK